jgi:hypothetical protein
LQLSVCFEMETAPGPWKWYKNKGNSTTMQRYLVPWLIALHGLGPRKFYVSCDQVHGQQAYSSSNTQDSRLHPRPRRRHLHFSFYRSSVRSCTRCPGRCLRSTQRIDPVCFSNRTPRLPGGLLREGLFDGGCRRSLLGQDQEALVQAAQAYRPSGWPRRRRRTAGGAARIRRRK